MRNLILILIILVITSCSRSNSDYISFGGFTQGTTYSITYESLDSLYFKNDVEVILANFDTSLSTYNQFSLITKINNNESNKTDFHINTVINKSEEIFNISKGAFDITVAPLVNAWGFGFKNKEEITNAKIDSILDFVGFNKICLNGNSITKIDPRIMIDVNAIAQGYSVDVVADFLEEQGINNYLVEIGGELKTKGANKKGKDWRIGIDKPFDNNNLPGETLQAIIKLSNKSLATSGNYRKFYERNGIKYSHTIDPKTGYPVTHSLLSTTVIANDCITADAYATTFMVMGLEKAFELAQSLPDIEAYFIYSNEQGEFQVKATEEIKELIDEVQ
jgi:thiamine biosynthesis lipoprotein